MQSIKYIEHEGHFTSNTQSAKDVRHRTVQVSGEGVAAEAGVERGAVGTVEVGVGRPGEVERRVDLVGRRVLDTLRALDQHADEDREATAERHLNAKKDEEEKDDQVAGASPRILAWGDQTQ